MVANEPPHDGTVLLLHPRLVVLVVWARARVLDAVVLVPSDHRLVKELAPVVTVEAEQFERQLSAHLRYRLHDERRFADGERNALGPAAGDVRQGERVDEAAGRALSSVRDEIDLQVSRRRLLPVPKSAHRHTAPKRRGRDTSTSTSTCCRPRWRQHAIDSSGARSQQLRAYFGIELEMPVALERVDKDRNERLEPLAADAVRCFPQHDERLADCLAVDSRARRSRLGHRLAAAQDAHRVLAVAAGHCHELIQDAPPLFTSRSSITLSNCPNQLFARRHAQSSPHRMLPPLSSAVADYVRQRPPLGNNLSESMRSLTTTIVPDWLI